MPADGLTRDHVVWAYRLLLDREPESEAVILPKLKGYQTTRQLRADIVTSREYQDKNPDFASTNRRTVVIADIDAGLRLFVDLSDQLIGLPIIRGEFEPAELAFIGRVVHAGAHVLDVGAHIGLFAMHLARLVGPTGSVTAFEPFEENATLLSRSIAENHFGDRLRLVPAAVGDKSGTTRLTFAPETLNSGGAFVVTAGQIPAGHAVREVPMVALDDVALPTPIAFIKMDVEGAEPLVLEGAGNRLRRDRPIILTELHQDQLAQVAGVTPDEFLRQLHALGYSTFRLSGDQLGAEVTTAPPEPVCSIVAWPGRPV